MLLGMAAVTFLPKANAQEKSDEQAVVESYDALKYLDSAYNELYRAYQYLGYDTLGVDTNIEGLGEANLLAERLQLLDGQTPFELKYNDRTKAFINLYVVKRKELSSRVLGYSDYFFPMIEEALDKNGLPLELKYLAVVESALNPAARSRAGAVGLWQFMYSTGKMYKLYSTSYVDERMDPIKATEAACGYLKDLFKMYGNWELALAAYNSGPGNVNKAIRRSGGKRTFWEIYNYLPRETRSYVPSFIAVNYLFNHYKDHGIRPTPFDIVYHQVDTINISRTTNLNNVAALTSLPVETLQKLNPSLKGTTVPGSPKKPYALTLPLEQAMVLATQVDSLYEPIKVLETAKNAPVTLASNGPTETKWVTKTTYYRVRRGDALIKIAKRHHVYVSQIKEWNNLRSNNIRVGQRLAIKKRVREEVPVNVADNKTVAPEKEVKSTPKTTTAPKQYNYHVVQKGDTLWDIANAKGVSVNYLRKMNPVNAKRLKPGQKIIIGVKKS